MNGLPIDQQQPHSVFSENRQGALSTLPQELRDSLSAPPPPPSKGQFSLDADLTIPLTPTTPSSPNPPLNSEGRQKKSNPLNDLIDTERQYVDQLTGVIRKVAAAWSRTNLPPSDLDTMFRSIEGVFKANRGLYTRLKEIGANPSSPKALGDLLMRWIEDLRTPYTTYCTKFCVGFDIWEPVQSNPKLAGILEAFSASCPPPATSESPFWTLDALFLLPKIRLKYYKKLYGRLLKTTEPGRSDYRLLVGALDTLEFLLGVVESRSIIQAGEHPELSQLPSVETGDLSLGTRPSSLPPVLPPIPPAVEPPQFSESDIGSTPRGSISGGERSSQDTAATTASRASTSTLSMPVADLERRLKTDRTLDIFTMKPKVVTLHMNPPTITFTRELRFSGDVVIRFVPRNSTEEVIHRQGHVFLLSDLFLICERMSPEEQAQHVAQGADMWLCYPPLAGKVLRVADIDGRENVLQVAIMRKEFLNLELPSPKIRNALSRHLKDCIDFSSSLPPPAKGPPPPVPPINPMFVHQGDPSGSSSPVSRIGSPQSLDSQGLQGSQPVRSPPPEGNLVESMNRMRVEDQPPFGRPLGLPGPNNLRPSQPLPSPPPPFGPKSVPPPTRNASLGHSTGPPPPGPPSMQGPHMARSPFPPGPPHTQGPPYMQGPPPPQGPPHMQGPPQNGPPHMHGPPPNGPPHMHGPPPNGPPHMHGPLPNGPPQMQGSLPHGIPPAHTNSGAPFAQPSNYPGQGPLQGGAFTGPPRNGPFGLPPGPHPQRPPSEPQMSHPGIKKTPSSRSLGSQYQPDLPIPAPPIPSMPGGFSPSMSRNSSYTTLQIPQPRPLLPSANARAVSMADPTYDEPSPPGSPVAETPQATGPVTITVSAQMKCKVFLQQQHAQWKMLGSGKLKLYRHDPINMKQLVVEAEDKNKSVLVSTFVLTDGVERVGKTGVAIELSDKGSRTGVIYMIQLRNENSANGLYESLLSGSDRSG